MNFKLKVDVEKGPLRLTINVLILLMHLFQPNDMCFGVILL